jgi:predicted ATPase/DNA-binding CsgD family transcriptional regulator
MPGLATIAPAAPAHVLVGRNDVLPIALDILHRPEHRLLTITGPAGVGKTRLAFEVGRTLRPHFPGGVFAIDLTTLDDPAALDAELARTIGIRAVNIATLAADVERWLAGHRVLLILDNAEHLLGIGSRLVEWIAASPHLRLIVTSRQRLHLSLEIELELHPLDTTADGAGANGRLSPAGELFARMAGSDDPARLKPGTRRAVERIAARLEGLPLALELVAARVPSLSAEPIDSLLKSADELAESLPAVASTLHLAVERSYTLLSPGSRALLRLLTVCRGGFSLELAERIVAHAGPADLDGLTVADCLEELSDHHLIQLEDPPLDAPRFGMLAMVAEAIGRHRDDVGETNLARDAHACAVIGYAEAREYAGLRPKHEYQIAELNLNYHNIIAAIARLHQDGNAEAELRLVGALTWFWYAHGHYADGLVHFERVRELDLRREGRYWARFLTGYGILLDLLARFEDAREQFQLALAAYEPTGFKPGLASTCIALGFNAFHLSLFDDAESALELAIQYALDVPDLELGKSMEAVALSNLGANAHEQRKYAAAEASLRRAAAIHDRMQYQWGSARAKCDLGGVLRDAGKPREALVTYRAALEPATHLGDYRLLAVALSGIATLLAHTGPELIAAWIFGGVDAMRPVAGTPSYLRTNEIAWQEARATARATLGERAWDTAYRAGGDTGFDELLAVARDIAWLDTDAFAEATQPITKQEGVVLNLIVRGLPTSTVASMLGITERTVSSHLGSLFRKYEVNSRLELLALATHHRGPRPDA